MDTEINAIEESLALANGYASLKSKKLAPIKGPAFVSERINAEFQAWVERRMEEAMGARQAPAPFSSDEADALRELARQILSRKTVTQQPAAQAPKAPQSPRQPAVSDLKKHQAANHQILNLAQQIAQMNEVRDSQGNPIEY